VVSLPPRQNEVYLQLDATGLAIISPQLLPLYINEFYAKLNHRRKKLGQELLIQAVKLRPETRAVILDLTAGLGKDAVLLASFGYQVTMVERNPILATILHYALSQEIIPPRNLTLIYANSLEFLANYSGPHPQVIYLDPMFKEQKAAKAKKDMQLIQMLTHHEEILANQDQQLFQLSLHLAPPKLIVKRDNKQLPLALTPKVSYVKQGKTVRYDVYTN
ncbi:MAG: class I SAM-dependent methyltransferase, partial [Burkholderiales bacterium]